MTESLRGKRVKLNSVVTQSNIPAGVMQTVIMHALQLPSGTREVFLLCDIQRSSLAEAAALLGVSQATAAKKLKRARKQMKAITDRLTLAAKASVAR